jgi:imidazolonepropionase-like amidohydrolase
LAPLAVVRAATTSAGRFLGRAGSWGELRVGARADLVLLDGDPFASIEAVARPAGVMVGGVWLDRAALDARLARWRRR